MTKLISLFDYLGRAAGPELGLQVATYAKATGAEVDTRLISNKKYRGPVNLYTESFLQNFFQNPMHETVIDEDKKAYAKKLLAKHKKTSAESNSSELPF